ncbi:MAG: hypothetical protein H8E20_03085 [Verrucomicrobia bacterium]|nr:hypothetical protein [Verrucomicrobiota bacterium]
MKNITNKLLVPLLAVFSINVAIVNGQVNFESYGPNYPDDRVDMESQKMSNIIDLSCMVNWFPVHVDGVGPISYHYIKSVSYKLTAYESGTFLISVEDLNLFENEQTVPTPYGHFWKRETWVNSLN